MANQIKTGNNLEVRITKVYPDQLLLRPTSLQEGGSYNYVLVLKDYGEPTWTTFIGNVQVGDIFIATITSVLASSGDVTLSREHQIKTQAFTDLRQALEEQSILKCKIKDITDHVWYLEYKGVKIQLPARLIDRTTKQQKDSLRGKEIEVKIIKYTADGKIDASREYFINQENTEKKNHREEMLQKQKAQRVIDQVENFSKINIGDKITFTAQTIEKNFCFGYYNSVPVSLNVGEYDYVYIDDLKSIIKIRDKIEVIVLDKDPERKKLKVSRKALILSPFAQYFETHQVGDIVDCTFRDVTENFYNYDLAPNVKASMMKQEYSYDPTEISKATFRKGEVSQLRIIEIDTKNHRIRLSRRQLTGNLWENITGQTGEIVDVVVSNILPKSILVQYQDIQVEISDRDLYVNRDEPRVSLNDTIKVKVTEFNKDRWLIKLNARVLKEDNEKKLEAQAESQNVEFESTAGDFFSPELIAELKNKSKK